MMPGPDDGLASQVIAAAEGIRIRRLRLRGVREPYEVSFLNDGVVRSLSVIAGPVSTGKTAVLEFIEYLLGGSRHPEHPEVLAKVTSAAIEVELSGVTHVIERAVGEPSTSARVYVGTLAEVDEGRLPATRYPIAPAGSPDSLSTFLLAQVGLEGVMLREAPSKVESESDPLSVRDLMWLCFLPNKRLDDENLLFEGSTMKAIKLAQVIDVVYGVHDHRAAELADRITRLERDLAGRRADLVSAQRFVSEQEPRTEAHISLEMERLEEALAASDAEVAEVDSQISEATSFASDLREHHRVAAAEARRVSALLRDRETLLVRMAPLRGQYSDDIRKLTMLVEAHELFDPLQVSSCPACFSPLQSAPEVVDHHCGLCGSELTVGPELDLGVAVAVQLPDAPAERPDVYADPVSATPRPTDLVAAHLRSTRTRLRELNAYIDGLDAEVAALKSQRTAAVETESQAALALDVATVEAISPFLARRDELRRLRQLDRDALEELQRGLRLHEGLVTRQSLVGRLDANLSALRDQRESSRDSAADRQAVVAAVSRRFGEVLAAIGYPKLTQPFVNDKWVPFVRGADYRSASSGGKTLLALAWFLAVFEVAVEQSVAHPGFVLLDSPQKNIGASADPEEGLDAAVVEGVYTHIRAWLSGAGTGCQVIVVDNDPPPSCRDEIVRRFTRDPQRYPYGLIDDEYGAESAAPEASSDRAAKDEQN